MFSSILSLLSSVLEKISNLWRLERQKKCSVCQSISAQTHLKHGKKSKRQSEDEAAHKLRCNGWSLYPSLLGHCMWRVNDIAAQHKTAIYGQGTSIWCSGKKNKKKQRRRKVHWSNSQRNRQFNENYLRFRTFLCSLAVQLSMKYISLFLDVRSQKMVSGVNTSL